MMEFLYFPEDKSEYLPAIVSLLVFIVFAAVTMIFIIKASQKEERNFEQSYKEEQENKDY